MKKSLIIVLVLAALQGLIHNIGHPVTPALVTSIGIPDKMFGVFFAAMSLGLMIGGPIFGTLGDKFQKNKLIFWGLIVYSVGQASFGLVENMYLMTFFRVVSGLGVAGIVTLFVSYVIEISEKDKRAKNLALLAATITLFAGIGYKLGGFLNGNPFFVSLLRTDIYSNIFVIQGVLNIGFAFLVLFFLKEPDKVKSSKNHSVWFSSFRKLKDLDSSFLIFLFAIAFISIGAINLSKYIDVYFNQLGYSPNDLGSFVLVTGIISVLSSLFLVPLVIKYKRELTVMIIIQIASAIIVFIAFRQSQFLIAMYTIYMIYVILRAIYLPYEQNFISEYAEDGSIGTIMGIRQSFLSIGMILGPVIAGYLYEVNPIYVFDLSAIMFLIGFVLFLIVFLKIKKRKQVSSSITENVD
ncbi:MAG: MFS transporter [Candidatus Izemoplasmatales bacterium]|jgi:DHA1 family multidrug resistance protein-like MFS transporter|nr:MFS transporter [Candidatus Izemoplasmatales bacterium]